MGNHYDPNEGAACAFTERGNRAKEKIAAAPAHEIGSQLHQVERALRRIEKAVLGGEAIDDLRAAVDRLRSIT